MALERLSFPMGVRISEGIDINRQLNEIVAAYYDLKYLLTAELHDITPLPWQSLPLRYKVDVAAGGTALYERPTVFLERGRERKHQTTPNGFTIVRIPEDQAQIILIGVDNNHIRRLYELINYIEGPSPFTTRPSRQ